MTVTKERKTELISQYRRDEADSGSPEVQIAVLTARINNLTEHMDEKTAMKMFEAFFTTKNGGSGLGLPTARKIIEAHGGRIDVHSEVGRGTQFTLEFPTPLRLGD